MLCFKLFSSPTLKCKRTSNSPAGTEGFLSGKVREISERMVWSQKTSIWNGSVHGKPGEIQIISSSFVINECDVLHPALQLHLQSEFAEQRQFIFSEFFTNSALDIILNIYFTPWQFRYLNGRNWKYLLSI